jgi:hypothetical protein
VGPCWRQKLDRRPASSRTHSQERQALPAFAEAVEQPVSTHLARIRVAQGKHSRHGGLSECHPATLPLAAERTPRFRFASCLPQLSLRPPTFSGTAAWRPRPRGAAAPDLSIGITEVLVTAQDIVPGLEISTLADKSVVFPLPLLGQPGATRLAPCLGAACWPMGQ